MSTTYIANNPLYYGDTLEIVLSNSGQEINMDKVTLNAVPLPPTLLLMGSGLMGLGGMKVPEKSLI